ncbi:hypothetical protein BH23ACT9_BH23ACT9_10660 [soil metagenome]
MNTVIALYVTTLYVNTKSLLGTAKDRLAGEEGQTTMEWMGIAAIVVAILAIVLGASGDLGELVRGRWVQLFNTATTS